MLTKSCNPIDRLFLQLALVAALVTVLSSTAFASKKEDNYKAAQAAAAAGRADEALRLYCDVAKEDPSYKDAQQNCNIMRQEAAKEAAKNEYRFQDCQRAFNEGRYDDAEQKCSNVRSGQYVEQAQDYLHNKIPAARAKAKAAGQEAASNAKFDQAVQAFNNNAFDSSSKLFNQVAGDRQGDAQNYLKQIKSYLDAMQAGDNSAKSKNYKAAISSYSEAEKIKSDGPGDPGGKISTMKMLLASANTAPVNTTPVNNTPVNTIPVTNTPPPRQVVAAVVEPARPRLDIQKLLREADAAKAKGDYGVARGKYLAVLAEDPRNLKAMAGKESLPVDDKSSNQKAGSEADVMLAKGIGEFYSGKYEDAEVHIKDYIEVNGGKTALAYFYRAASLLTRYYLAGERPDDRKLMTEAQESFRSAKKAPGFNPPNKVSPKIMKVFKETS